MTISLPSVLLLGNIVHAKDHWSSLSSIANLKSFTGTTRQNFFDECARGAFNDVVAIYRTFESAQQTGLFDAELISHLPPNVKFLSHNGAGYDQIDIAACSRRDIQVSNTPGAVNEATADVAMFLIIGALRRITPLVSGIRQGKWKYNAQLGHDPRGKALGVLGLGGIGSALAHRAEAFGMQIQYHNRRPVKGSKYKYVSFSELLETSDVISVHMPLTAATRHTIGNEQFAQMKDGVVVVNTARGAVIDEAALVEALESGKVYSAGLDVFEEEPKIHQGLLRNENVFMLPHIGTMTYETQKDMEVLAIDNVRSAVTKDCLVTLVPEQA